MSVTGYRNAVMIDFPVLDDRAEDKYHKQHKRTKPMFALQFDAVAAEDAAGEADHDGAPSGLCIVENGAEASSLEVPSSILRPVANTLPIAADSVVEWCDVPCESNGPVECSACIA